MSRTVGMPGYEIEEWLSPLGILSLSAEKSEQLLSHLHSSPVLLVENSDTELLGA